MTTYLVTVDNRMVFDELKELGEVTIVSQGLKVCALKTESSLSDIQKIHGVAFVEEDKSGAHTTI